MPAVIAFAVLAFSAWMLFGSEPRFAYALVAAVAVLTRTVLGSTGNTFTLAASTTPASNGTVSGTTLTGAANGHTFVSGTQTLPSMSIEVGLPDVPFFGMNYGARPNSLSVQAQRSGLLSATVNVIAQGEATATATAAGTPTVLDVERFSQFQGSITRNGAVLGNIVSAELMYSNNLEKIEVIRSDGRIADIDPGIVKCSGNLNARFQDTSLLDQATARTPCEIAFGWTIDASRSLLFTAHRVFLASAATGKSRDRAAFRCPSPGRPRSIRS